MQKPGHNLKGKKLMVIYFTNQAIHCSIEITTEDSKKSLPSESRDDDVMLILCLIVVICFDPGDELIGS